MFKLAMGVPEQELAGMTVDRMGYDRGDTSGRKSYGRMQGGLQEK